MSTETEEKLSPHLLVADSTWMCPGDTVPISRALHMGRLAAGWPACENCVWRHETEHSTRLPCSPGEDSSGRNKGIRRTEFGVRGAYLNAIDRFRAAQLASIFSTYLNNRHAARNQSDRKQPTDSDAAAAVQTTNPVTIAVGFDGRRGSPDIYAGVISAVRQNGCHVVDAGRCTASSLLHVLRSGHAATSAIMVTGAGGAASDCGIDVFLRDGQTIAVPWQDFGVAIRMDAEFKTAADPSGMSAPVQQALHRIRGADAVADADLCPSDALATRLIVPDAGGSTRLFRSHRRSGSVVAVSSESAYRNWLLRWWPRQSDHPLTVVAAEELTIDRLRWLTQKLSLNLQVRRATHAESTGTNSAHEDGHQSVLTISIDEDDRGISVMTARGRRPAAAEVAQWMNMSVRTAAAHVTAHASPEHNRLWLVDIASPDSAQHQEVITDGLVATGFLLTLLRNGKNPLPT